MRALLRRGVERHPLLWTALLGVAAVLVADGPGALRWTGACLLVLLFAAFWLSGRHLLAAVSLVVALSAGGFHSWRLARQRLALESSLPVLECAVKVVTPPKIAGRGWSAMVKDSHGSLWWFRGTGLPPLYGESIAAGGNFSALPVTRNPGQFDFRDWAHRKGISGLFAARSAQKSLAPPSWLDAQTTRFRDGFSAAIVQGLDPASPEAVVIRAMVLGEVPPDPEITEPFRLSGTLHAFSVSGLHVAMLAAIGWLLLRLVGVSRRTSVVVLISAMAGYVWITGMSPPSVRALTMASVVLCGFLLRRRGSLLNVLGLALLAAVLLDGHLIFQAGVQLSFGVVAAIGLWSEYATWPVRRLAAPELYLPRQLYSRSQQASLWLRTWFVDSFGVSAAATAGSLPLLIWHFGLLSPISIVTCIFMGPVIFAVMLLAFISAIFSFAPPVSTAVNHLNRYCALASLKEAQWSSALPGGHFQIPLDRPGRNFLIVYDPGNAAAAAVLHDGDATLLFDTAQEFSFKNLLIPSLQHFALTPEALVLSHPDTGHTGGALLALNTFPIRQALLPVEKARSPGYRSFLAALNERGIPHPLGQAGYVYPVSPGANLEILHVAGPELAKAPADERVMVTRLNWRGWRILFTSDTGWTAEQAMIDSGIDLSADVIVMGRNSRDGSGSDAFLAAVHPQAIVAAHSDSPITARIPENWLHACEERGIKVLHQGHTGAVSIVPMKNRSLELRGYVDGSVLVLRH
jgi:ComEC/Rec2-related protein